MSRDCTLPNTNRDIFFANDFYQWSFELFFTFCNQCATCRDFILNSNKDLKHFWHFISRRRWKPKEQIYRAPELLIIGSTNMNDE